jgi:hypothetical protein
MQWDAQGNPVEGSFAVVYLSVRNPFAVLGVLTAVRTGRLSESLAQQELDMVPDILVRTFIQAKQLVKHGVTESTFSDFVLTHKWSIDGLAFYSEGDEKSPEYIQEVVDSMNYGKTAKKDQTTVEEYTKRLVENSATHWKRDSYIPDFVK